MTTAFHSGNKGKKKNRVYFTGKKNIVAAELYDDLQDKIEQVKKVVRNRSKMDIALVLRSCEQADNAVDAAIAKLIGPDGGKECLQEWAVQSRKSKTKQGASKLVKTGGNTVKSSDSQNISKQINDDKVEEEKGLNKPTATLDPPAPIDDSKTDVPTVQVATPSSNEIIKSVEIGKNDLNSSKERVRRSRPNKKKPRPPKRIRDKLKQLVPPDNHEASIYQLNTESCATSKATPTSGNDPDGETVSSDNQPAESPTPEPVPHNNITRPSQLDTNSTGTNAEGSGSTSSSTESGICSDSSSNCSSIISTGTVSPVDSCSPVREVARPLTLSAESFSMQKTEMTTDDHVSNMDKVSQESSFKKLLKDLHRCDVSLSKYQHVLNEQCDSAIKELQKVFTILRIGLSTREEDIYNEIQFIRQTAGHILHRRKVTCGSLKQLSESAGLLEESQTQELKKQLKQFITERRIDEELGLSRRFTADPDDLLPSVMKFGKTCGVQAYYNSWNEFPAEVVVKNAAKPPLLLPPVMPPLLKNAPPLFLPPIMPPTPPHMPPPPPPPPHMPMSHGFSIPFPIPPHAILKRQSVFNKIPILPTPPIPPVPQLPLPPKAPTPVEFITDEFGKRRKYAPEKLVEIQERVKESLKAQGVCLYNPFTGEAMKSTELGTSHPENNSNIAALIKKTPTQQRRERKRRQKEREKRQKELMVAKNNQKQVNESITEEKPATSEDVSVVISNKVGKPASVSIIKSGYRPWWQRKYNGRHPPPNTVKRPHPLTPPTTTTNRQSSKATKPEKENQICSTKKENNDSMNSKDQATKTTDISTPITVT